jgi:hypothetical protein
MDVYFGWQRLVWVIGIAGMARGVRVGRVGAARTKLDWEGWLEGAGWMDCDALVGWGKGWGRGRKGGKQSGIVGLEVKVVCLGWRGGREVARMGRIQRTRRRRRDAAGAQILWGVHREPGCDVGALLDEMLQRSQLVVLGRKVQQRRQPLCAPVVVGGGRGAWLQTPRAEAAMHGPVIWTTCCGGGRSRHVVMGP